MSSAPFSGGASLWSVTIVSSNGSSLPSHTECRSTRREARTTVLQALRAARRTQAAGRKEIGRTSFSADK